MSATASRAREEAKPYLSSASHRLEPQALLAEELLREQASSKDIQGRACLAMVSCRVGTEATMEPQEAAASVAKEPEGASAHVKEAANTDIEDFREDAAATVGEVAAAAVTVGEAAAIVATAAAAVASAHLAWEELISGVSTES